MKIPVLRARMYYSYNQFLVYDEGEQLPGCAWTEAHSQQGFARRQSTACFNTLTEYGHADVALYQDEPWFGHYNRVIAVPFHITSGAIIVEGPEETGHRRVPLAAGFYRLTVAQRFVNDEAEEVDIYFELLNAPLTKSEILVADDPLSPPDPLIETSDVAGE